MWPSVMKLCSSAARTTRRSQRVKSPNAPRPSHGRFSPALAAAWRACIYEQAAMFQIIFNELSAAEMSALPKTLQLELLAEFQIMPEDLDRLDTKRFGVIERQGKKLYRF